MIHAFADIVVVHPRSRRAVHEARLDTQREVEAAATAPLRIRARVRGSVAIARVLAQSLPAEIAAIPAGDVLLRMVVLAAALALFLVVWNVVRPFNPGWLLPLAQSRVQIQALVWIRSALEQVQYVWPVALLWYARRSMPPLALAVVIGALAAGLCGLPTVYFSDASGGPMLPHPSWTPLPAAATAALLAASVALTGSLVVRIQARAMRVLFAVSMCGGWFLWTWTSDLAVQEITRTVYGRPLSSPLGVLARPGSLAGIFAVEQAMLTHVGFAVLVGLAAIAISRTIPARPTGPAQPEAGPLSFDQSQQRGLDDGVHLRAGAGEVIRNHREHELFA